jgi:hypothetical protein
VFRQTTPFAVNTGHFGRGDTRLKNATIFRTLATRFASYFTPSLEKYGVTVALVLQLLLEFLTFFRGPIHSADGIEEQDAAALSAGKFRQLLILQPGLHPVNSQYLPSG